MSEPIIYRFPSKNFVQPPADAGTSVRPPQQDCHTQITSPEIPAEKNPDPAKIRDIEKYRRAEKRYRDTVAQVRSFLSETSEQLHGMAVDLAVSGPWREWDEEQPIGTEFCFDHEMLLESGDSNVAALVRLSALLEQAIDLIEVPRG